MKHFSVCCYFFHPVCPNSCPSFWRMQTNWWADMTSEAHRLFHLLSFVSFSVFSGVCVRPECNTPFYRETMGRQPWCQNKFILPSVWSKPLDMCEYLCVYSRRVWGVDSSDCLVQKWWFIQMSQCWNKMY